MMNIIGTRNRRVALAVGSLVLISLGIFFALQDLGTAVKYASIGSFFLGLFGAAMTATSLVVTLRSAQNAEEEHSVERKTDGAEDSTNPQQGDWSSKIIAKTFKNSTAIVDPQAPVVVNNRYGGRSRKRAKR